MANWSDNVFRESAPSNRSKVKFGAPHVVDFGRELEHSPDGKLYIVGHGASSAYSPHSWMQGSEVYLARCAPTELPKHLADFDVPRKLGANFCCKILSRGMSTSTKAKVNKTKVDVRNGARRSAEVPGGILRRQGFHAYAGALGDRRGREGRGLERPQA